MVVPSSCISLIRCVQRCWKTASPRDRAWSMINNYGGKIQTYIHPTRICFEWLVDEVADLCKTCDLRKQTLGVRFGKAHQRSVHEDIFNAGELSIETSPKLKQRSNTALIQYAP